MLRLAVSFVAFAIVLFVGVSSHAENSEDPGLDGPGDILAAAAYEGDFTKVKSLLSAGADVNAKTRAGYRALYDAAFQGHDDLALFLLGKGAAPETAAERHRGTTLMNAASSHCVKTVRWLLQHGVRTNTKDDRGWTALMLAAAQNNLEIVRLLVEHRGTRINLRARDGGSALYTAVLANALEVVEYLLRHGADPTIRNGRDWTALDYARYHSTCDWKGETYTARARQIIALLPHPLVSSPRWLATRDDARCGSAWP